MSDGPKRPNEPRKRGRPKMPVEQGKRHALGLRTTKELRDLLQQAADSSGRSLAQEIELRLERSMEEPRHAFEAMELRFGREVAGVTLLIALAMSDTLRFVEPWVGRDKERPWPFQRGGPGMTTTQIEEFDAYLRSTMPAHRRRGIWDPYIFDQLAKAADLVLRILRPEGSPSVPQPKGKDPHLLAVFLEEAGNTWALEACQTVLDDQRQVLIRDLLGDVGLARLQAGLKEHELSGSRGC